MNSVTLATFLVALVAGALTSCDRDTSTTHEEPQERAEDAGESRASVVGAAQVQGREFRHGRGRSAFDVGAAFRLVSNSTWDQVSGDVGAFSTVRATGLAWAVPHAHARAALEAPGTLGSGEEHNVRARD